MSVCCWIDSNVLTHSSRRCVTSWVPRAYTFEGACVATPERQAFVLLVDASWWKHSLCVDFTHVGSRTASVVPVLALVTSLSSLCCTWIVLCTVVGRSWRFGCTCVESKKNHSSILKLDEPNFLHDTTISNNQSGLSDEPIRESDSNQSTCTDDGKTIHSCGEHNYSMPWTTSVPFLDRSPARHDQSKWSKPSIEIDR